MKNNNRLTYRNRNMPMQSRHRQRGALLVAALVILLVLTLLGVSAVSSTNIDLQIAGNQQRQHEAELVAENTVNFLVENYPSTTMPTNATFETFNLSGSLSQTCVTKTIIAGTGTPGSLDCDWDGDEGTAANAVRDHEKFDGATKSCLVGNYIEEEHPHLHHMSGSRELWIDGDVTIKHCGGCFDKKTAEINYTGNIIWGAGGTCTANGGSGGQSAWPSEVTKNKVTQVEFNVATGASGPSGGGDFYSQVELRVTSTDPVSGATATAVKGFKYRGDSTTSTTTGSPTHADCGVDSSTLVTIAADPLLTTNGSKRVLYSYLEID